MIACGDELVVPVSFLINVENIVDIFHLPLHGAIQTPPVKPMVIDGRAWNVCAKTILTK